MSWDSSDTWKANDPQAFIFSLDHKTKLTCHDQQYVIYCGISQAVYFGYSDIIIYDNLASGSFSSCCSYGKNEGIAEEPYYLTGNTEDCYFTPTEVEVYQVVKL